ncbi:non-canonical purine NTP pyrophosphatase [Anaerotruncus sp. CAG:390]|nr:non-canonical purine NTP pyrophosphatase [Anaerotruncus sp. CAG:390]
MKLKILIATRNRGKLAELERLLSVYIDGAELTLLTLDDVGFTGEIVENGATFAENAMIKAKTAADFSGLISVGDDSGLCVYALDGEPGVLSARYAGEGHDDAANNRKLLEKLKGVSYRDAAFVCDMACVFPEGCGLDGEPIEVEGRCEGEILCNPRGEGGFGYDPLFWYDEYGETFAELSQDDKNAISHRGVAAAKLCHMISERIAAAENTETEENK